MTTPVPPLLAGLVDDAAVFPPGRAPLQDAVAAHRAYRAAWYRDLVGPLLLPASALDRLGPLLQSGERPRIGLIADDGIDRLARLLETTAAGVARLVRVEAPVAKRGEDPQPGLNRLLGVAERLAARHAQRESGPQVEGGAEVGPVTTYAEIPLTLGLFDAMDILVAARERGLPVAAKFRTGGLAAELFPTPDELAAVICGCRDRRLPFKLTAGLHHAIRHTDTETGFVHHGFLNVLAAAIAADRAATVPEVTAVLSSSDPVPLIETARRHLDEDRPLWVGYGTCSITEPLTDLTRLGLITPTETP